MEEKRLLNYVIPNGIENEIGYQSALGEIERLMAISDRTLSEDNLLDSLALLVEQYELIHHPVDDALPHEVLAHLMETNKLKPKSLIDILGSKRQVSAVLSGKKEITKNQARKLGAFFRVDSSLFICNRIKT